MVYTQWKVLRGEEILGQVLTFEKALVRNKVTKRTLDGVVHIQTIGSPSDAASVVIFCSFDEKDRLNLAEAEGALLDVIYKDKVYSGYIEEAPDWETVYPGQWFSATVNLLIDEINDI